MQRGGNLRPGGDLTTGKQTLTETLPPTATGELGVPSPAWPTTTAIVSEQTARAHGLVQFHASPVQLRGDELQQDLDQLAGQSDGEVADDVVHDADHAEEARALYQQGQAAYQQRDYIRAGQLFERAAVANRSERGSALYNAALAYGRALRARDAAQAGRGGGGGRRGQRANGPRDLSERDLAALDETPGESAGAIADQATARSDFDEGLQDFAAGEDETAAQNFERSAARAPEAAGDLNYNAGMAHFRGGNHEAAVRTFRAALGLAGPSGDREDGERSPQPRAVQRREHGAASRDESTDIHQLAEAGIRGAGGTLPHHDAIQRAFGHHDVGGILAHVGGEAASAASGMNALAYASGDHVAFGESPDLHLAAHEATHIVQQRGGVSLKSGIGETGDPYEQQADDIADRVVRGESVAGLLDGVAQPQRSGAGAGGVQLDTRRPLRERPIRFQVRVPERYPALRDAIVAELSQDLMSRTEVEQPDGTRAPIRREAALVDASNLEELYGTLRPGSRVVITGRLIPGQHRYEQIIFSIPNRDAGVQAPINVEGRAPQVEEGGETPARAPEGIEQPDLRRQEEIRDAVVDNAPGAALEVVGFISAGLLGTLASVASAALTVVVIAGELADLADNSGQTTEAAKGFGVAFQSHRIAEYAFEHTTSRAGAAKGAYLSFLRGTGREVYGRLRQKILDATGDLNAQCTRAMQRIDAERNRGGQQAGEGRRFASQQELSDYLIATASARVAAGVHAGNYNSAYQGSGSYSAGTPALR